MKKLAFLFSLIAVALPVASQDSDVAGASFGVVIYSEGDLVSIIRDRRRQEYDAFTGELLGLPVYAGDVIQTDPGTYVEIQLLPSRSVIKVAENTSFTVRQVTGGGEGVFDLAYGRLRARVDRLTGNNPFEIRGSGIAAGVRGTDFGTDVVVAPGDFVSLTKIYCFEGEIAVQSIPTVVSPGETLEGGAAADESADEEQFGEPIIIGANQMVVATTPSAGETRTAASSEVTVIDDETASYWAAQDFIAEAEEAEEVLARFPDLRSSVSERLGDVQFLNTAPPMPDETSEVESGDVSESEPEPAEAEIATAAPTATEAVAVEADEDAEKEMDPERRKRLISTTKITGITLLTVGGLADAAAATLYFFGDDLFPSWPAASDNTVIVSVGASGAVFLFTGLLTLFFSAMLSQ